MFEKGKSGNPETQFTSENASEKGKIGAAASVVTRRRKKSIKEAMKLLMEMEFKDGRTGAENVAVGQYNKAVKGDTQAAKFIAEMLDEYKSHTDITTGGQPFEMKVVQTSEKNKDEIEKILNGDSEPER